MPPVHANLETFSPYEALSYTWGNPKTSRNMHPLSPNADQVYSIRLGDGCAYIKYNLEAALQHLRSETQPRTLWIDALCID
jgi:Heterokaryon incompatibility protein (HET)